MVASDRSTMPDELIGGTDTHRRDCEVRLVKCNGIARLD